MIKGESARLELITDNLANSSLPGYKKHVARSVSFNQALNNAMNPSESTGIKAAIDFSQGKMQTTDRPLDFAISGEGFFVVAKGNREYYTRCGNFLTDKDGNLVTAGGLTVQGTGGAINIPAGIDRTKLTVDSKGNIATDGQTIGQLKVVKVPLSALGKAGPNTFYAAAGAIPRDAEDFQVSNGILEGSNSTVFEEMAELMTTMRAYETSSKMLKIQDGLEGRMISEFQ